uniref:DUF1618 domain-containing protein n=1 Tax=Oryza punctata TaxID=4537 RepID=A0A0E0MCY2_ORYPU
MDTGQAKSTATLPPCGVYPRRVILNNSAGKLVDDDDEDYSCSTAATARTSAGHVVRVSFRLEAPPAASRLCFSCFGPVDPRRPLTRVVAARDSVLVMLGYQQLYGGGRFVLDYFVYNAGAAAADDDDPPRSPLLSLLPPCRHLTSRWRPWPMPHYATTGLLRRGKDEDGLVVVDLFVIIKDDDGGGGEDNLVVAELLVLRSGEWSVTPMPIIHDGDNEGNAAEEVFDESPKLRYVSLPINPPDHKFDEDNNPRGCPTTNRSVCATDGDATLKFIDIGNTCDTGQPLRPFCRRRRRQDLDTY